MAREQPYDAIVLDVMLPGIDGYEVCASLRRDEVWAPILVLTARDNPWDEVHALDTGADDFLAKPFSYAVLVARLRALVRRGAPERPVVLEAGYRRRRPRRLTGRLPCRQAGSQVRDVANLVSASGTGSTPIPGASGTGSVPPSSTNSGVTSSA
jgi:DNA-binding response OmpR family regulator